MFTDNDVSKAEEICDPNVKVHNLLVSSESQSLEEWKKSLSHIFKGNLLLHLLPRATDVNENSNSTCMHPVLSCCLIAGQ